MATHDERLASARQTINYICSRPPELQREPVPNCPGWTVYNAAVHIGRVGVAWHSMILATPDDPDSRNRGYADAESRGSGHDTSELASWALAAVDALDDDLDRPCYFSMTGGEGTVELWGWHAASELAVHRLDVEAALGDDSSLSPEQALDALEYAITFFLPAMARVTESEPGQLNVVAEYEGAATGTFTIGEGQQDSATITGTPTDLLLAVWGRPHGTITTQGSADVLERWRALPAKAFQFGTWD